ncbi:MAG: nucleoside-diphosphate sugar epimerase/dehydratase [Eubacterium sp.]
MEKKSKDKATRIAFLLLMDTIVLFLSYFFAFLLVYNFKFPFEVIRTFQFVLAAGIVLKLIVFFITGMYNTLWRYASIEELWQITFSVALANILTFLLYFIVGSKVPTTVQILTLVFDLIMVGAIRIFYRTARRIKQGSGGGNCHNVLIVGAGEAGIKILRELGAARQKSYVVGFVDDSLYKQKKKLNGLMVLGGRDDIEEIVKDENVDEIIIALPSVNKKEINAIAEISHNTGASVKILPNLDDILNYDVSLSRLRDLQIEDLLDRDEVVLDKHEISNFIRSKVVLVTGGAGSIGSELCRQIIKYQPKQLIVLDIYENTLYYLELELYRYIQEIEEKTGHKIKLDLEIGSIREKKRMCSLFEKYKPEVVFHAAAHKHVPLMEKTPKEAVKNNIFGTRNILEACVEYHVEKFVQISTDKAVKPTNVMGTTKRVCEMLVQLYDKQYDTDFVAVRFGNVLGSNGSVIPIFKEQIANGGPLTVTDPDIERFFMTIPEATQLVLQAGSIAHGGEIFVLDMGEAVKIKDLAERMAKLSGFTPYTEMPIVFTGLRPGEKLYEELSYDVSDFDKTRYEDIFIEKPSVYEAKIVENQLKKLGELVEIGTVEEVISQLQVIVPDYSPNRE